MNKNKEILCYRNFKKYCNLGMFVILIGIAILYPIPQVLAETSDPLVVINNLSNFMAGIIKAVGGIILIFGVVQIGLSIKSNDPTQRTNGFLSFAGGLLIAFSPEILNTIMK